MYVNVLTSILIELYFEVSGQNDIKVTWLVQSGHLVPSEPEAMLVVISADVHQRLLALDVHIKVITFEPP